MKKLIECVPNFSEGRDIAVIKQITDEIEKSEGVKLLDVDPGASTNRTVVTFVGTPDEVIDAAFKAIKKAQVDAEIAGMMRDFDRQYSNGVASNIAYNFMCNMFGKKY